MTPHPIDAAPKRILSNRWLWVIGWLVSQLGGLAGIALNWESDGAYGLWSAVAIGLILLVTLLLWFGLRDARWRSLAERWSLNLAWLLPVFGICVLAWALPMAPIYPLDALRWALTIAAAGLLTVLVRGTVSQAAWRGTFLIVLVLVLLFSLATVMIYPRIYTDEGWHLNYAWSSIHSGPLFAPSINLSVYGAPQPLDAEMVWWPVGLWLRAAGLGIWQGRLFMWFSSLLMVALLYRAARTLYNDYKAAILTALLAACSVLTLHVSHFIRQEIIFDAAIALMLYLHARVEKRGRLRDAFGLGLLLSLTLDIHTNTFIYIFAFGLFYLGRAIGNSWSAKRIVRDMRLIGLVIGGLFGVSIYLILHVLPDFNAFMQQANVLYGLNYGSGGSFGLGLTEHIRLMIGQIQSWFALSSVEGNLVMLALLVAIIWRPRGTRSLLILSMLCFTGWVILGSRATPTYVAFVMPITLLLVGGILSKLLLQPVHIFVISALLLAGIIGVGVRRVSIAQQEGYNEQFETCLADLEDALPEDGVILGEHLFWLARPRLTDYAARTLVEVPWPTRDVAGWWAWIDPDIVLWPGPIYGPHRDYMQANGYVPVELPGCPPTLISIWLKPGVQLNPPGD